MRHRKANVKLGRTAAHRRAMLKNMATSIFEHGAITTTVSKAKAIKPIIDRLITLAKRGDLHAIRQASALLTKPTVLKNLFGEAKEKFSDRVSGYASMARVGLRAGDAAVLVKLRLLGPETAKAVSGKGAHKISDRSRRVAATKGEPKAETNLMAKAKATITNQLIENAVSDALASEAEPTIPPVPETDPQRS
ncbi:MAG: 50S ribosomal protein L17 [Deltaproteobacteria bacterium]|jgi:large subunit ribosomal protein L17|nr:50S ribosomal protein L17 [Deltaproteobacteria bacterium]